MGYQIKCDDYLLHDVRLAEEKFIVQNPKCTLEVNTCGTASFYILSQHPNYGCMKKLRSIFEILQDGEPIFRGRMTEDTRDFDNTKMVDLEGVLAFFNDSVVRPFVFPDDFKSNSGYKTAAASGNVVEYFLSWLIENHNEQVEEFQQLKLGKVTVSDPNNYISRSSEDYLNTWEVLKTRLFDSSLGGYLCIRYEADGNYVDYLEDFEFTNSQSIEYGENLLDLTCESDATATYSAIIPVGADIEYEVTTGTVEGEYVDFEITETVKEKTNISGLADGNITDDIVKKGDMLYSKSAVAQYGWICAPVSETTWDDVTDASNLQSKGVEFLQNTAIMLTNTVTVQGFDLHLTDAEIEAFRIYGYVPLLSKPHELEDSLKLTKLDLDLQNPQNTVITLGEIRLSLTDINAGLKLDNAQRLESIVKIVSTSAKKAISKVTVYYYLSESETELTGGEWSTTPPEWKEGYFFWQMMTATHADGTVTESDPVCVSGKNGKDAVSVDSIVEQYYQSTSATALTGGTWSSTAPAWANGKYIWTRSVITYTDGSFATTAAVCVTGAKGDDGTSVKILGSYASESELKAAHTSGEIGDGYLVDGNLYVWDGSAWTNVGNIKGEQGDPGIGISAVDVWYYLSTSSTALSGGSWSTTAPTWKNGYYMWSKTVTTYSTGATSQTNAACITGAKGATGAAGTNGSDGVGVSSIATQFYLSTSKTTQSGGSWVSTMPEWSTGYYLWTRSVITYTDGSTEYTAPICDSSWEAANEVKAELTETFNSKFEQFADEITLEITGSLGSNASIVLTAGGVEKKTTLELSKVREAFANDDTAIDISAGIITFNSGTIVINSTNFQVDSTGNLKATNAVISGNITASTLTANSGGTLAGWSIDNNSIRYGTLGASGSMWLCRTGTSTVASIGSSDSVSGWSIGVGKKFGVTSSGVLYCSDAYISGSITTDDGSYTTKIDNGSVEFYYDDVLCGSINTKFTPYASSEGVTLCCETGDNGGQYIAIASCETSGTSRAWTLHYYLNMGYSETYSAYKNIFQTNTLLQGNTYMFAAYASAFYLKAGAMIKSFTGIGDSISVGYELLGFNAGSSRVIVGNTSCTTMLRGSTVYLNSTSTTVTSDRNAKNSIEALPEAYEAFIDNLEPVRFKYNDGTSGRYHVGYIAQDVEAALTAAGLSTTDFAGYVDIDFTGELGLSYDEFIAILHQKIKRLENRIAALENT